MSNENLKKELHDLINNTDDEDLLSMVREELVAYQTGEKEFDDLHDLSPEDRAELEESLNEDPMKDTITEEEFKQHLEEWCIKLSTKRDS